MALKVASVIVSILGDESALLKSLNASKASVTTWAKEITSRVSSVTSGLFKGLAGAATAAIGGIFRGVSSLIGSALGIITKAVGLASDLNESISKTGVAFGSAAQSVLNWSKNSVNAIGQTQGQALEAASSFGLLFTAMGKNEDEAAKMSIRLVELATDMASIQNIPIEDALASLKSGLVGESEPMRKFGVLLTEDAVAAEAMREGLAHTKDEISESDKLTARYNLTLNGLTKTQGDYQRTLTGIANQERQLTARRTQFLTNLGSAFAPIWGTILRAVNQLLGQMDPYGQNIIQQLAAGLVHGIIFLLPAVRAVRDFFIQWFKPGSPPKILPDLVKWASDTMQVYLSGFSKADFGVLEQLGGTIENILRSFVASGALPESELLTRVFGTRDAIGTAIAEWRTLGSVTTGTLNAISSAAGPAGTNLANLVNTFFALEGASQAAAQAQEELTAVTERYDSALAPLNKKLQDINDKEQAIHDRQSISADKRTIRDPASTANQKRLALLDIEKIKVNQQINGVQRDRDAAVDAAQKKLDAAQKQQQSAQKLFDTQQALFDQQIKINNLIAEEVKAREKQAADIERIRQAQLQYNLAIADTPGKIALMQAELARTTVGSEEYYNVLTQIANLEDQLKRERGATDEGVLGSILPSNAQLVSAGQKLADTLWNSINKELGLQPPVIGALFAPQAETPQFPTLLGLAAEPGIAQPGISQGIQDFVATIKEAATNFQAALPSFQTIADTLSAIAEAFGLLPASTATAAINVKTNTQQMAIDTKANLNSMTADLNIVALLFRRDWGGLWDALKARSDAAHTVAVEDNKKFWADISADNNTYLHNFSIFRDSIIFLLDFVGTQLERFRVWYSNGILAWKTDAIAQFGAFTSGVDTMFNTWAAGMWDHAVAGLTSFFGGLTSYWDTNVVPWWTGRLQWFTDLLPGSEPKDPSSPFKGLAERGKAIIGNIQMGIDDTSLTVPPPNFGGAGAGAGGGGRIITFQAGAIQINGVAGASAIVPSLESAFAQLLAGLANG
jgi:hypothetical protein